MKSYCKLKYILAFSLELSVCAAFAHDVPVHQAITYNAAASAFDDSPNYSSFLNRVSLDMPSPSATNAMIIGSGLEDNSVPPVQGDGGGYRSVNHFYDPLDHLYGKGLSEAPPDHRIVIGTNSFAWGSISNCAGYNFKVDPGSLDINGIFARNVNTSNRWSWPIARGYEWFGLTATNQSDRFLNLSNMFRVVGQVMHLVEDLSQPQHVRNEQHVNPFAPDSWRENHDPYASPIEIYGRRHVHQLNYQHGLLDWRGYGFAKAEDFWDRHLYNGNPVALDDDENGGTQLGLAEWCNGNFLGARHLFPEFFKPGDIEYYPYPSRDTSTDYKQVKANPITGVDYFTNDNGTVGRGIYLSKTGDGISYKHIARINYLGAKIPGLTGPRYCTINDPNVLADYHNQIIPKAVEYAAGLLDYYFRGTMDVQVSWDTNLMFFTNTVLNTSGQDFQGGAFYLYQDDANASRTLLCQTNLADLAAGGTLSNECSLTFLAPGALTNKLLMVYQGTIGYSNGAALDPVDANIAIAATRPWLYEQITTNSYEPALTNLNLQSGATITTNLESGDFGLNLATNNYEVIVNFADFDDKGTIGSIASSGPITSCSYPCQIVNSVVPIGDVTVTPDGRHLSVPVTATDDPLCGDEIGWRSIIITWRVWPGQ